MEGYFSYVFGFHWLVKAPPDFIRRLFQPLNSRMLPCAFRGGSDRDE